MGLKERVMSRVYGINKGHHITKSLAKSGVLMSVMALSVSALATVGGGQRIEILGYDKAEQKVFVLRHYDDGRGRLPQLYYYDFTSKINILNGKAKRITIKELCIICYALNIEITDLFKGIK